MRIIAGFRSRNIVDVYDMFLENGTAYIVMEYLEGETLEARLDAPAVTQRGARAGGSAVRGLGGRA